jgi:hypothetical protein
MDMSWRRSGCGSAVTTRRHCGPDRRGQPEWASEVTIRNPGAD